MLILVLSGILRAEEKGLAGVWSTRGAMAEPLECMCGHDTQLVINKAGESGDFEAMEYCIGHHSAIPLGEVKRSETELTLTEMGKKVSYKLDPVADTLTLVGDTTLGKDRPLILKRVSSEAFFKELSGMRANELRITRSSRLFPTYLEDASKDPFEKKEENVAPEAKAPAKR